MSNGRRSVDTEVTFALLQALHFQCAQQLQHLTGRMITQTHLYYSYQQSIRKYTNITHINSNYAKYTNITHINSNYACITHINEQLL